MFWVCLVGKGCESIWCFRSPTWFDQGSNISTDMKKGAQRTYMEEFELDMVVPAGCLLGADYRESKGRLTFVD